MIDSPQINLTPEGGAREDEHGDPAIGSNVWDHLINFSERMGEERSCSLSITDHGYKQMPRSSSDTRRCVTRPLTD